MKVYQVQFKDNRNYPEWTAFNAHMSYDILFTLEDAEKLYNQMIAFHETMTQTETYKIYHRIVCYEVSDEKVLKEE